MEKSEPSLVPEWLNKGVGIASSQNHQDEGGHSYRQQRPHLLIEPDVPRYSTYVPPRRTNERFSYDKEIYSGRVYPNFGRGGGSSSYRSSSSNNNNNQDFFDREKEIHHREWDSDIISHSSSRVGFDVKEQRVNGRWHHELPVRRPVSVGNAGSFRENGDSKPGGEGGNPVQKAAFERNFPSLGAQEKPSTGVYSSLANVAVLSPRHHWRDGTSGFESRAAEPTNGVGVGVPAAAAAAPAAPKMAEALVQNPPRVRTPPQLSVEALRLEELALKQSRQLVPMIPKTTNLISSRDKAKSKGASGGASKIMQSSSSQMQRPASARAETPKTSQSKLQVLKPGAIPDTPAARSSAVNSASAAPRKQKQLLDRRQVPIPPLSTSTGVDVNRPRSKENGGEDKRLHAQAQNRIDFFNAIRKKAASAGTSGTKADVKVESSSTTVVAGLHAAETSSPPCVENGCCAAASALSDNDDKPVHPAVNGVVSEEPIRDIVGGSEEEENRFLKSLGWVEDAGGEDELTEEEINAFYQEVQEHMRSKTSSPLSSVRRLNAVMSFRCTGLNSFSSGINLPDSESDSAASNSVVRS